MNRCSYQSNAFGVRGEMKGQSTSVCGSVVCPKPRRLGPSNPSINDHIRPSRWHVSHHSEICDSKEGSELLDIILTKGSSALEKPDIFHFAPLPSPQPAPPFFCGSPPSRASNPVIQDTQFGSYKLGPPGPPPTLLPSSASSSRKGGACVPMKFGQKPAAVRIEGFDCLSCDRGNCSISAVA